MQLQGLWLVLAGFVLGFAVSTLWEWLYYRRQRWRQMELMAPPKQPREPEISAFEEENGIITAPDERFYSEYRSPGIYLESEQDDSLHPHQKQEPTAVAPTAEWSEVREKQPGTELPPSLSDLSVPLPTEQALITAPVVEEQLPSPDDESAAQPVPITQYDQTDLTVHHLTHTPAPDLPFIPKEETAVPLPGPAPVVAHELLQAIERVSVRDQEQPRSPAASDTPAALETPPAPPPPLPTLPVIRGLGLRASDYPDDLAKIHGIGEIYKERLYAAGIYTWQQIADSDVESLRRITRAKPNADLADWQNQARSLVKRYNRMGALYHGPPPDDLTSIEGIGPTVRDALYRAGIATYAQLAASTPTTLAQIVPTPTIGTTYDFVDWIEQAARRAPPQV